MLVGVCSLVAWLAALRRYRLIADTPTSLIASAAQGYVKLVGRCELHPSGFQRWAWLHVAVLVLAAVSALVLWQHAINAR